MKGLVVHVVAVDQKSAAQVDVESRKRCNRKTGVMKSPFSIRSESWKNHSTDNDGTSGEQSSDDGRYEWKILETD